MYNFRTTRGTHRAGAASYPYVVAPYQVKQMAGMAVSELNAARRYLSAAAAILDNIAATQIEAIERAAQICAAHLCFGNYAGRPLAKRTYAAVFDQMMEFHVDQLVLEFANRELAELELCREIAAHKDLAVGLVDVKSCWTKSRFGSRSAPWVKWKM